MKPRRFKDDLAREDLLRRQPWVQDFYKAAYPGSTNVLVDSKAEQKLGGDRIVTTRHGRKFLIQEKYRDWSDGCLLETIESIATGAPGWINKLLDCDEIVYFDESRNNAWIVPYIPLKRAWFFRGNSWLIRADDPGWEGYFRGQAKNVGYTTEFIIVPWQEIRNAMVYEQPISWGECK